MAEPQRANSLGTDRKRSSIQMKSGLLGEKTGMKQILTAPSQSHSRRTPGGQLFLCIMGSVISTAICIWVILFSKEDGWRKGGFACGAAGCACLFAFLAFTVHYRAKHPPEPEPLPDLSQRRSTIGARVSKRSIAAAGIGSDDSPSQVLVVGDKTRPSLTVS